MIFRHRYRDGIWIDLEQPTEDEIRQVARELSINARIEKEILMPTPMPLVIADTDATLLVLHFPAHGAEDGDTGSQEVDFIVSDRFIVTARYEVVAPLYHLKKLLETQGLVGGRDSITTDVLLEVLFAHLYTAVRNHTNHTASRLERIEKDMFDNEGRETVRSISRISREFLHIKATLANQEEPLSRFLKTLVDRKLFGSSFIERMNRILAERIQVARLVEAHRSVANDLRETNASLLEVRQSEIMKTLTTINFIFLPLGLITWTFAMRTEGMPLIDSPHAFWIVLGIMVSVAFFLLLFFIRRRWLL